MRVAALSGPWLLRVCVAALSGPWLLRVRVAALSGLWLLRVRVAALSGPWLLRVRVAALSGPWLLIVRVAALSGPWLLRVRVAALSGLWLTLDDQLCAAVDAAGRVLCSHRVLSRVLFERLGDRQRDAAVLRVGDLEVGAVRQLGAGAVPAYRRAGPAGDAPGERHLGAFLRDEVTQRREELRRHRQRHREGDGGEGGGRGGGGGDRRLRADGRRLADGERGPRRRRGRNGPGRRQGLRHRSPGHHRGRSRHGPDHGSGSLEQRPLRYGPGQYRSCHRCGPGHRWHRLERLLGRRRRRRGRGWGGEGRRPNRRLEERAPGERRLRRRPLIGHVGLLRDHDEERRASRLAALVLRRDGETAGVLVEHLRDAEAVRVAARRYLVVGRHNRLVVEQPVDLWKQRHARVSHDIGMQVSVVIHV